MFKSYKHLQSQGHVKKWPTVVVSVMLIAYLVVEIIQRRLFAFADPLWPCTKDKVIEMGMIAYDMYRSTVMPPSFCNSLKLILSEILQVKK